MRSVSKAWKACCKLPYWLPNWRLTSARVRLSSATASELVAGVVVLSQILFQSKRGFVVDVVAIAVSVLDVVTSSVLVEVDGLVVEVGVLCKISWLVVEVDGLAVVFVAAVLVLQPRPSCVQHQLCFSIDQPPAP